MSDSLYTLLRKENKLLAVLEMYEFENEHGNLFNDDDTAAYRKLQKKLFKLRRRILTEMDCERNERQRRNDAEKVRWGVCNDRA